MCFPILLRFTPDGQKLIVFTPPNEPQRTQWTAVVWDVETARELARMSMTESAFGPGQTVDVSNQWIAVVLPIGTVRLHDLKTGKQERLAEADEPAAIDDARPIGGAVAMRFSPQQWKGSSSGGSDGDEGRIGAVCARWADAVHAFRGNHHFTKLAAGRAAARDEISPERTEGVHGPGDDPCYRARRRAIGHDGAACELVAWHGY